MSVDKDKVELLHAAFDRFSNVSHDLERCYSLLEEQARQLKIELANSNRRLQKSETENEALREHAERNRRLAAVGEMASRMAHELRNPLGSIELFACLLQRDLVEDEDRRRWAEHITTAVGALDYSLSNLLIFTGKPRPQLRRTDLKQVITEAHLFATHLLQQGRVTVVESTDAVSGAIWTDHDLLRQVLLNLTLNAVEAMPDGGTLSITGATRPDAFVLTVRDTGVGIAEDALPRVFDPFFTTKPQGHGLGLAIVQNAVSALGGQLHLDSRPGHGTVFTLTLPSREGSAHEPRET